MKPEGVLIVEDVAGSARGTEEFMVGLGYQVKVTSYAQEWLSRGRAYKPDHVLLGLSEDAARVMDCSKELHRSYGLPIGILCAPMLPERELDEVVAALPQLPLRLLDPCDTDELRRFVWDAVPTGAGVGGDSDGQEYGGGD